MNTQFSIVHQKQHYTFTKVGSLKKFCLNKGLLTELQMEQASTLAEMDDVLFHNTNALASLGDGATGLGDAQQLVKQFHQAFNHPVSDEVVVLDEERMKKRVAWLTEEVQELAEAKTPEDIADAIGDIIFLALGTAVESGIHMKPVFHYICEANMRKLGPDGQPIYKEDNKIAKPQGWYGPEEEIKQFLKNFNSVN